MLVLLFNTVVKATGKRRWQLVSWLILHQVWILEPFRIRLVSCLNSAMPVVSVRSWASMTTADEDSSLECSVQWRT